MRWIGHDSITAAGSACSSGTSRARNSSAAAREHDAETERCAARVLFGHHDVITRAGALQEQREQQSGGAGSDDRDTHFNNLTRLGDFEE